jgi:hypothetical protein
MTSEAVIASGNATSFSLDFFSFDDGGNGAYRYFAVAAQDTRVCALGSFPTHCDCTIQVWAIYHSLRGMEASASAIGSAGAVSVLMAGSRLISCSRRDHGLVRVPCASFDAST